MEIIKKCQISRRRYSEELPNLLLKGNVCFQLGLHHEFMCATEHMMLIWFYILNWNKNPGMTFIRGSHLSHVKTLHKINLCPLKRSTFPFTRSSIIIYQSLHLGHESVVLFCKYRNIRKVGKSAPKMARSSLALLAYETGDYFYNGVHILNIAILPESKRELLYDYILVSAALKEREQWKIKIL